MGLDHLGKEHAPQCLVSTAYDVFRRLPIARTVQPMAEANEREEVKALLPQIPHGGVLLFDRGYPSYDLLEHLQHQYEGLWVLRCPASHTFPAVETFVHFAKTEVRLRAIRMKSSSGEISVFLTTLQADARFPTQAVLDLY